MPEQHPEGFESFAGFIVKTEVDNAEKETLITKTLGRIGLTPLFFTNDRLETALSVTYGNYTDTETTFNTKELINTGLKFTDIRSPYNVVWREHFDDFLKTNTHSDITLPTLTRTFHTLVDGKANKKNDRLFQWSNEPRQRPYSWVQVREPKPLPGIQLVKRTDMGIPPFHRHISGAQAVILSNYGIVAGTIPESADTYVSQHKHNGETKSKTIKTLEYFTSKLKIQI